MYIILFIVLTVIYIAGMFLYIDIHSYEYKDDKIKTSIKSMLWSILILVVLIKIFILSLNELTNVILSIVGYKNYEKSKIYKYIDEKFEDL